MANLNTLNRSRVRIFVTPFRGRFADGLERAAEDQLGLINPVVTHRGITAMIGNGMVVHLTPRGYGHRKLADNVGRKGFRRGNASYNVRTFR
jgi:hypothetical protein